MKAIQRIKQFSKFFSKPDGSALLSYPSNAVFFLFGEGGGSATPHGLQEDLSFLIRGKTQAPTVKAPSPNHWTAKEFPNQLTFVPKIM